MEYISKEKIINWFEYAIPDVFETYEDRPDFNSYGFSREAIKEEIEKIPSAQVVSLEDYAKVRMELEEVKKQLDSTTKRLEDVINLILDQRNSND